MDMKKLVRQIYHTLGISAFLVVLGLHHACAMLHFDDATDPSWVTSISIRVDEKAPADGSSSSSAPPQTVLTMRPINPNGSDLVSMIYLWSEGIRDSGFTNPETGEKTPPLYADGVPRTSLPALKRMRTVSGIKPDGSKGHFLQWAENHDPKTPFLIHRDRAENELVGCIWLDTAPEAGVGEVVILLGPDYKGRGYGKAIVKTTVETYVPHVVQLTRELEARLTSSAFTETYPGERGFLQSRLFAGSALACLAATTDIRNLPMLKIFGAHRFISGVPKHVPVHEISAEAAATIDSTEKLVGAMRGFPGAPSEEAPMSKFRVPIGHLIRELHLPEQLFPDGHAVFGLRFFSVAKDYFLKLYLIKELLEG